MTSDDSGASVVSMVMLTPIVIVLTLLPVQAGFYLHARNLATAAAQEAAAVGGVANVTDAKGEQLGREAADAIVGSSGMVRSVHIRRSGTQVTASVLIETATLIPGVRWTSTATHVAPIERYVR